MPIAISLATAAEKPRLGALLNRYLADQRDDGRAPPPYRYFDDYWQEREARWPYLIKHDNDVVGFALVNSWSPSGQGTDFSIAEYYIEPRARRRGHGTSAAGLVFKAHPGLWELAVLYHNSAAQQFWPLAIAEAGGTTVERVELTDRFVYRFFIEGSEPGAPPS